MFFIPTMTTTFISFLMALLAMAFYTLLERKFLGYFQLRKGPNKVILMGLPQPLADALKLFLKEQSSPSVANFLPFLAAPMLSLFLALILWTLYPTSTPHIFFPLGIMLFLCVSSMNVYTTLAAGWFSNSKYALLGSIRSVAQTISYEVSMALIMLSPLLLLLSFDLSLTLSTSITPKLLLALPLAPMWFISILAESSRTPFDFAEGESELVSGFNTEYSAGSFALIFMAEYMMILFMSLLTSVLFSSFYIPGLTLFLCPSLTLIFASLFIWVRATLPRIRYDQLMALTWKNFLPIALTALLIILALTPL